MNGHARLPVMGFMLLCSIAAGTAVGQTSSAPAATAASAAAAPPKPLKDAQSEAGEPRVAAQGLKEGATAAADKRIDRVDLDTTTVTGNRELPKVMYVVPWKKSDIGDLAGKPMNSLLDEVLSPVDRDVFRREVTYFHAVNAPSAQISAAAAPPGPQGEK
jgi:hypothetical protein